MQKQIIKVNHRFRYKMGTCSTPLFITVTPGNPKDYVIVLSELSQEDITNWDYAGFLSDKDKSSYTLTDFMNTESDCHKVLYYFTTERTNMWINLCKYISKKYKVIENIRFHFYCQDEQFPYYIEYISQYDKLILYSGSTDSIYWFKINDKLSCPSRIRLTFDKESYKANWQQSIFKEFILN